MRRTHRWRILATSAVAALAIGLASPFAAYAAEPVAVDDEAITDEDVAVDIDVLDNDSDADVEDTLEIVDATEPANGTVEINADGTITYTPDADFNGTDEFEYTITDGEDEDTATVELTVEPVNDPPVAEDDEAETDVDTSVVIDVLDNDEDVDGDEIELVDVSDDPENGTAVVDGDQIEYTPDAGFEGTDEFAYTITDGEEIDTATVVVRVGDQGLIDEALAICEAGDFTHPSLFALCRVLMMVPEEAQATIAGVVIAHSEKVAPGWLKNHGDAELSDDDGKRGGPPAWVIAKKADKHAEKLAKKAAKAEWQAKKAEWKSQKDAARALDDDVDDDHDDDDEDDEDDDDDRKRGKGNKGHGGPPWTR